MALMFGQQKINLHQSGSEFIPNARAAIPGSADICLLMETDLNEAMQELQKDGVDIIEGPV